MIVIRPPLVDLLLGVFQRQEPVLVQALFTKTPVEGLDKRVVRQFAWATEVELYLMEVGLPVQRLRHKLRAVVDTDRLRRALAAGNLPPSNCGRTSIARKHPRRRRRRGRLSGRARNSAEGA